MTQVRAGREPSSHEASISGDLQDHPRNTELHDLQQVELSILREFVRVCEAHGLRYYVAYGTLLGAVRHGGFIPWDDDIDVTMPRGDYNRFAEICASDLRPGFKWQSYATETHYPHWFGKVIKTDTIFRHALTERLSFQQAVYIDVFPLDGLADRPWEALAQRALIRICRFRLGVDVKRGLVKRLVVQAARVLPRQLAISVIEGMSRRFPSSESKQWICVGGPYSHRRQSFPSRWFGDGARQSFQDLTVVGPTAWDEYLTQLYGDYMTPPPRLQRMTDHQVTEVQLASVGAGGTSPGASNVDATEPLQHDE